MPLSQRDKALGFAFLQFLEGLKSESEQAEQVAVLSEMLSAFFGVNTESAKDKSTFAVAKPLSQLFAAQWEAEGNGDAEEGEDGGFAAFQKKLADTGYFKGVEEGSDEYKTRLDRARAKFNEKIESKYAGKSATELKDKGNQLMKEGKQAEAVQFYSKAIELDDKNAVFYCNRAAAYTHLKRYGKAAADARSAIEVQPDYVKAHGRLGTALFSLKDYDGAIASFEKAAELDPSNQQYKDDLAAVKATKKKSSGAVATSDGGAVGGAGGFNPFGAMGGGGGMPGMPDMGQMMNQMMSNPELVSNMMSMMQTPQMQDMMGKMMSSMGMPSMPPGMMGGMPGMPGMGGPAEGGEEEGSDIVNTPFGRLPRAKFESVRAKMFEHPAFKENDSLKALMNDDTKNPMEVYNELSKHPEVFSLFQEFAQMLFAPGGEENEEIKAD